MITLGIETSCDETAVAVLKDRKILSTVVSSSMHLHKRYGGVVPEIATRFHVEVINYCFKEALKKAGMKLKNIDLISVTEGPGLIGALLIGISFAKALSLSLDIPLIGTNHVIAHLWANFLERLPNNSDRWGFPTPPKKVVRWDGTRKSRLSTVKMAFLDNPDKLIFPFIGLVVSGGHTNLISVKGPDDYRVLGQTQDDAAGEAFDKVAKILNLGYPGGPAIEKSAKCKAKGAKGITFSIPSAKDDSFDFSFSGIKTAVLYYVKDHGGAERLTKGEASDIAYAFQEAVCEALVAKAVSACRANRVKNLVVGGGVSANMRLREKLKEAARLNGFEVFIPPLVLCIDNAAMTAALGYELFKKGIRSDLYTSGFANFS